MSMGTSDTIDNAEDLKTAFARHKLGYALQQLWDERKIAIHWDPIPSARGQDYDKGRPATEISNLNQIAKDGAIVGGSYRRLHKNKMLVGVVESDSEIELLVIDKDENAILDSIPVEAGTRTEVPYEEEVVIYKCVQMSDCKVVTRQEQPLLFDNGVRPPFWSVCEWSGAKEQLRAIVRGDLKPYEVGSLTTDQLEIVCEEYLRIADDEYYRTAEIGGMTSDVDIIGASGDKLVWAQVTQGGEEKVHNKINKLGDYTEEDARVIIFAPERSWPDELDDEITFVPVEGVFATVNLNKNGSALLSRLLGREE